MNTPDILHCSEDRTFWVSWKGREVTLGFSAIPQEKVRNHKTLRESDEKLNLRNNKKEECKKAERNQ